MIYVRPPVADLLAAPDPKAERVSQLLCFTPCEPSDEAHGFVRVRGPDGYEGWIRESHLARGTLPEPNYKISAPLVSVEAPHSGAVISRLSLDTRFRGEATGRGVEFRLPTGETGIIPTWAARPISWRGSVADLIELGLRLRGVPYLWGGTSTFGSDCSGLVQRLFHFAFNFWLPRDSADQARVGKPVGGREGFSPGDLLFFPGHVALWLGNGKILHASARAGMVIAEPFAVLAEKFRGARRLDVPELEGG